VLVVGDDELAVVADRAALAEALEADVPAYAVAVDGEPDPCAFGALARRGAEPRLVRVAAVAALGWDAARAAAVPTPVLRVGRRGDHARAVDGAARRLAVHAAAADHRGDAPGAARWARALEAAGLPGAALDVALDGPLAAPGPVGAGLRAVALRCAVQVGDGAARDRVLAETSDDPPAEAPLLAAVDAACERGDLAGARAALDHLRALPRAGAADPATSAAAAERWAAWIDLLAGDVDAAWRRLLAVGDRFGRAAGHWDELVLTRPDAVRRERALRLAREADALPDLLEAVAAADPAGAADWLRRACAALDPFDQHRLVAVDLLGVHLDGAGLGGRSEAEILAAAVDALVRRRELRALRRSRLDRDLTVVLVAEHGAAATLAWLQDLEAAGHHDSYQLLFVDDGSRDETAGLLGCLEGDVDVLRLPVHARAGRALVEATARTRGRTALLGSTAQPLAPDALDRAVRAAVDGPDDAVAWLGGGFLVDTALVHESALLDPGAPSLRRALAPTPRPARRPARSSEARS
jgi:hypothetical protein